MQIQFLGAAGTVTGSKYLVSRGDRRLLVDCGLFQGYKQLRLRNWAMLPVAPDSIDAVLLTHAHIDHSGYLPLLCRHGFKGKVHCSEATAELCKILLPDSGHLQEEEAAYANRHGFSRHRPALPLYTRVDAERSIGRFKPVHGDETCQPIAGVHASFGRAGHLLGSRFVRLQDTATSVLFSGDLGRPSDLVLAPPAPPPQADYLVIESTYGNRQHTPEDVLARLAEIVQQTASRGGTLLIPSFAVGRAQTLLYCIHLLRQRNLIPYIPVFLDSPMAANATALYQRFPGEHQLDAQQCQDMCAVAKIVNTPDESRAVTALHGPKIIVAASGMATGGRVVHHLKALVGDRRNTVLFVGFQAGGTRGDSLLHGARTVRIHGQDFAVRAHVTQLDQLSTHADAGEVLAWIRQLPRPPRRTFITHGEPAAADALRQRIERELGWTCHVPEHLESIRLD